MQDHAEHDISKCIHLIDIFYLFLPPNPWEQEVLIPVVNHHFNPRSKICMTITYFWRQNHPTILQAINPLAFCLNPGPQIMKHHTIPAYPKQKSLESFHDFPTYTFSLGFFRSLWSMTTLPLQPSQSWWLPLVRFHLEAAPRRGSRWLDVSCMLVTCKLTNQTFVFYLVSL